MYFKQMVHKVSIFLWIKDRIERENAIKMQLIETISPRNVSRRGRKERKDYVHFEKMPASFINSKYITKHTSTKLEQNDSGPKFTIIK